MNDSKAEASVGAGASGVAQDPAVTPAPARVDADEIAAIAEGDVSPDPVQPAPRARQGAAAGAGAMVLGGVLAALIGAGGAILALPHLPPQFLPQQFLPQPPAADMTQALDAEKARITGLESQLAALKAAPSDATGLRASIDQTAAALATLQDAVKALDARVGAMETRAPAVGGAPTDLSAVQAQLDTLKSQVAALTPAAIDATIQSAVQAATSDAEAQLKEAEAQTAQLRSEAETAVKRAIAQSAVVRLVAAYDAGLPLGPALAGASAAGVTVPQGLSDRVPSLAALQSTFPEAARAALAASRKAQAGEGFGTRIGNFLMAQTGARSVSPRDGSDADAVLSRAQAALDAGDVAGAVSETAALPEAGRQAMADWTGKAQARVAAGQALATLTQSLNQ